MFILKILKFLFLHLKLLTSIVEEFLPSITGWPVIVFSLVFSIYWYGHINGTNSCENKHMKIDKKMEQKHAKIETNVNNTTDSDLNKRLHKYQRD